MKSFQLLPDEVPRVLSLHKDHEEQELFASQIINVSMHLPSSEFQISEAFMFFTIMNVLTFRAIKKFTSIMTSPIRSRSLPKLTKEELDRCSAFRDTEDRWMSFNRSSGSDRAKLFADFCQSCVLMINSLDCQSILFSVTPKITADIIKSMGEFCENYEATSSALIALTDANTICPFSTHNISVPDIFYNVCLAVNHCEEVWDEAKSLLIACLSEKACACALATSPKLLECLKLAFIGNSGSLGDFLNTLFFEHVNKAFFASVKYETLIQGMFADLNIDGLNHTEKYQFSLFLARFFMELSKVITRNPNRKFRNLKLFGVLKELTADLSGVEGVSVYFRMIDTVNDDKTGGPNVAVVREIFELFRERENWEEAIYDGFVELSVSVGMFEKMNEIMPFSEWFCNARKVSASATLTLFGRLLAFDIDGVTACIPGVFAALSREGTSHESYIKCLAIIEMLFTKRVISLPTLLSYEFLDVFVTQVPRKLLVQFFEDMPTFSQLLLDILSHEGSASKRELVFNAIVHGSKFFHNKQMFISLCSAILVVCPSRICVADMVMEVQQSQEYSFLDVFLQSFPKSTLIVDEFVQMKGLEWIFELSEHEVITVEKLSQLLMALVAKKSCKELNHMITHLHEDHPIFSLTQSQLRTVIFGAKDKSTSRPIKVPALFHKLDFQEETVDPYNAFVIGKYALPRYHDLSQVPFLACVANRFMLPSDAARALELPLKMESFCDPSYDHFPIFQFYPGPDVMRITHKFQAVSFWFRFDRPLGESEVHILESDALLFTLNGESLTATCEAQTFVVDATPDKWTHVYIRIEKVSGFGTTYQFRITINDFTFVMTPKSKVTEFTFLSLGSANTAPLLYLGSAIRFSDIFNNDISVLNGNGPGYIEPSEDLPETLLVTPFALCHVEIPLTCYPVPYMGFCLNNLSNRGFKRMLKWMCDTEDRETYDSVFRAACNINRITKNNNTRFWKQLLHNIKHAKLHPTVAMFKEALGTVLVRSSGDHISVFNSMIYSGVLWDILNPEILATALLECFPGINWKDYPDADIFLATVVRKNPENRGLITVILRNGKTVPRTIKLLAAMVKSESITDWESAVNRRESTLQGTIVECLIAIASQRALETLKTMFTFEELKYLFLTAPDSLALKVFHLMTLMAIMIPDFIKVDPSIEMKVASLSCHESIWKDVLFLVTGDSDCSSDVLRRPSLTILVLVLMWGVGIMIIHNKSYRETDDCSLKKLEEKLNAACKFLKHYVNGIAGTPNCMNFMSTYYPLILTYPVLFDDSYTCEDNTVFPAIPQLTAANMGDMEDRMWFKYHHVAQKLDFKPCDPPQPGKLFLRNIVKKLLNSPAFASEIDWNRVSNYIMESSLFEFIADVFLSTPLASFSMVCYNWLWLRPWEHKERSTYFSPQLLSVLMKRVEFPLPPQFSFTQLLSLTVYWTHSKLLSNAAVPVIIETFSIWEKVLSSIGIEGIKKLSPIIMTILVEIVNSTDVNVLGIEKAFERYTTTFAKLIDSQSLLGWCYVFRKRFQTIPESLRAEIRAVASEVDVELCCKKSKVDKSLKEQAKQRWNEQLENAVVTAEAICQQYKDIAPPKRSGMSEASFLSTRAHYIGTCKHFLVRKLMDHMLLFSDSVFPINVEKGKWENFLVRQQEFCSEVSLFQPATYHLSARCIPFCPPMVLKPSFSPFITEKYDESAPVRMFTELTSFIPYPPLRTEETLLSLFYKSMPDMGTPLDFHECSLIRYGHHIPSVVFWFPDHVILLTFAQLMNTGKEILFLNCMDPKMYHIFIESVIMGEYGLTTLFASHVVIIIPISSILYVHKHNEKSLALWTFNSGHFLLLLSSQIIRNISSIVDKIDKIAVESFPTINFLTSFDSGEAAYQAWLQKSLPTQEFLYTINCLGGRSYVDLGKYPYVPVLINTEGKSRTDESLPSTANTAGILCRVLPFRYFAKSDLTSQISNLGEIPATILVLPELLENGELSSDHSMPGPDFRHDIWRIREALSSHDHAEDVKQWVLSRFHIGETRTKMPQEAPEVLTGSTVINISRRKSKLAIVNNSTDKEYYSDTNFLYGHAESISVSTDGVYFAIDFAFGLTRAYKVIFSRGAPTSVRCLSEFSAGASPISAISGREWMCATASGKILVLWEIITGTVHRVLTFDAPVSAVAFDERLCAVWAGVAQQAVFVSLNGTILGETMLPSCITALSQNDEASSALCGTENGRLFTISYDITTSNILQREVSCEHDSRLTRILWQRDGGCYLTVDASGKVLRWNRDGTPAPGLATASLGKCTSCGDTTRAICQFCNKPVCLQCLPSHLKGPRCRHCIAFL